MKNRAYRIIAVLLLGIIMLAGYGGLETDEFESGSSALTKSIAKDVRNDVRADRGDPEDIRTYSSVGYWSETWWYWKQGISYTFKMVTRKEGSSSGGCNPTNAIHYTDVVIDSTYTFSPIK